MFNKNFSKEPTDKQKIGQIGEDLACKYLERKDFKIVERNYLKKWGEIDIITKKDRKIHFIEVKSVSRDLSGDVIHETSDSYRAEDNLHPWKLKRLGRTVQSYLLERDILDDIEWQFDIVTVYVDMDKGLNHVFLIEDIVL